MLHSRCSRLSAALITGLLFALAAHPALAAPLTQESGNSDDRWRVIFITAAVVFGSMLLLTIGYVFRRAVGVDKPPPVTLLEPGRKITGD